jgi:hypothetical protein
MPINPNIALGGQPVQQPNVLGQMGQMMALKAAAQEIEGGEGVRGLLKEGAPEDPTALLQYGKQGRATYESLLRGRKEQLESTVKKIGITSSAFKVIEDNPTLETAQRVFGDLVNLGAMDKRAAADAFAKVTANPTPENIRSLARQGIEYGITAAERLTAQTRIQAANISAGPSYGQLALAREKDARDVTQQEELAKLMRAPQTNALAAAAAPTNDPYERINNLDTRIEQLMSTGNPKAIPIAQALNAQRTQLLASAKNQYGGQETTMEVTDPDTGQRTVVKARPDQYGRLVPVEMGGAPLSTDASATGGTTISPTVARPAPTAAVIKERQAVEKLPEAIAMNTDAIRKIDEMIGGVDAKGNPLPGAKGKPHPGFNGAVGFGLGAQYIPGTDARGFKARHEEVLSQAFLDAFEALKGGGAITEKEGEKATSARTRMNLATSEKEYMDAAREYQGVLKRGIENARSRMQRSGSTPPASPSAPSSIDALLDKYK